MQATAEQLIQQAIALHQQGQLDQAEAHYHQALQVDPRNWGALKNLGIVARQRGHWDKALAFLTKARDVEPHNPRSYSNLGELHRDQLQFPQALAAYDQSLKLDPHCLEAINGRAIVLFVQGRLAEATDAWRFLIHIAQSGNPAAAPNPNHPNGPVIASAFNNLGNAFLEQGEPEQAAQCHLLACQWKPFNPGAHGSWLMDYAYVANANPAEMLAAARQWWVRYAGTITPRQHPRPTDPDKLLRVGFVSGDFRLHSVAYFLMGLFEHFDRSQFHFTCYAAVPKPDDFTEFFRKHATAWRDILGLTDTDLARQIIDDRIDILIDLAGHTASTRLRVFAHKPAPLQIAYLGYAATTGCPQIDYRLTDALADPPNLTDAHFSEKLIRLDRPAWCFRPPASPVSGLRTGGGQDSGLPFTFGSFNTFGKITPATVRLWTAILKAAPDSRIFIKAQALSDETFRNVVRRRFAAEGLDESRLVLKGRLAEVTDHLAAYNDVDLALDTFPYHGTTTTCEALYMNVPVLTLAGPTHHSRVGVSLLSALNLPELITDSPEQYVATAIRLATDPAALAPLRQNLRERLQNSPLMNEPHFTAAFCKTLRTLWRSHCT